MTTEIVKSEPSAITTGVDLSDNARAYAVASKSANTRRAYAAQIKLWMAFADQHGIVAFPADPEAVCNWLATRAQAGQSYSTLRTAVAAVRAGHVAHGLQFDTRAPCIMAVLAGIGRVHARAQKQAEPIRGADVAEMLAALDGSRSLIELRDAALLALGYIFGLRRSELTGLDLGLQGTGDGFLTIGARTIDLTIVRSKTAVAGEVERVHVPRDGNGSAVTAIERWIAAAGIRPGEPLLRGVNNRGQVGDRLHPQSVLSIVQRRIAEHHMRRGVPRDVAMAEAAQFSAHSLRVGFCVTAAEAGASGEEIATVTRHRSLEMPRRYAQKADKVRRSPFNRPGVGLDPVGLR